MATKAIHPLTSATALCRVVLALPKREVRQILRWALTVDGSFDVVEETDSTAAALKAAAHADLVVLDVSMARNALLSTLDALQSLRPQVRTAVLTPVEVPYLRDAMLAAGADAFVTHDDGVDGLVQQLRSVCSLG